MINFLRLKQDMEAGIDGMLVNEAEKISINIKKIFIIQFISFFSTWPFHNSLFKSCPTQFSKKKDNQPYYYN